MKKDIIRKRSSISTVMALLLVLMMTAVMTLAGTFAVFADDTVPDQEQTTDKIRDVSKKQEITFRGEDPNNGLPPAPPLPTHGQSSNYEEDNDDIHGTDENPGTPDLSDFVSEGGTMYPPIGNNNGDNNGDNNDNEIGNSSADDIGMEPFEENHLSSEPLPEEEGKEPSDPEKDKAVDLKIEGAADTVKNQPETGGNAVIRAADSDNDKSGTDKAEGSGSTAGSAASAGSIGTGSPKTGDGNGLADTVTLFVLSMTCLAAMMHGRRKTEE